MALTHIDENGQINMVDIGEKAITSRRAVARGVVKMLPKTLQLIMEGQMKKGDVLATARIAGIMGAKQTSQLIPLCHPLPLSKVTISITPNWQENCLEIEAETRVTGQTGVEMEALTAVSITALTIYDMAKAVDQGMIISDIRLIEKRGGKSDFDRPIV